MPQLPAPRAASSIRPATCSTSSRTWNNIRSSCRSARASGAALAFRTEGGRETLIADMTVGYKVDPRDIHAARSRSIGDASKIAVAYLDGPFRAPREYVELQAGRGGLPRRVLHLIRVQEPHARLLMGTMFDRAFRKFSEAFEERAEAVYGTRKADCVRESRSRSLRGSSIIASLSREPFIIASAL